MLSRPPRRGFAGLLLALLVSAALAGCFGDEDVPDPADQNDPGTTTVPTPTNTGGTGILPGGSDENESEQVPEAHYHHHWGNPPIAEVILFDGTVTLDHTPCFDADSQQRPPCFGQQMHIGSVRFNLETDGDQVNEAEGDTTLNGHADAIFSGTSLVVVTFAWDDDMLGDQLRFYYKPANSPMFLPREDQAPIFVSLEDPTVQIPIGPGMADPAHQYWISRWEFMLVADGGPQPDWQFPVRYASGEVQVEMKGVNGGKQSIDPPHPDPWKGSDMLSFDSVTGTFDVQSLRVQQGQQVNQRLVFGSGHEDIQMPVKAVVPTGTEKLLVRAWVNASDEAAKAFDWGLKFHGANTLVYEVVEDFEAGDAGARVYSITIKDAQVDPPYEKQSYFRFAFFPIAAENDEVGYYKASYTLDFEVHKRPDFTYYF